MIPLILGILFFCAFLYKLRDIRRDPGNLGGWAVLVLFAALTLVSLVRDDAPGVFGQAGVADTGVLIRNVTLVLGVGGLQLWHLHFCQVPTPTRRARIEAAVLLIVITALCLVAVTLPVGVGLAPTVANQQSMSVQLFYRLAGVYVWYALGCQLIWNLRSFRAFKQRWLRIALLLAAVGDLFLIFAQVNRAVGQAVVYATGQEVPLALWRGELACILVAAPFLLVGLFLPPIVRLVGSSATAFQYLCRYRELGSLDAAIAWAYPGLIRPNAPDTAADQAVRPEPRSPRQLRFAYLDRLQLCRDGYSRGRSEEIDGSDTRPQRLARVLRTIEQTAPPGDLSDEHRETEHLVAVSRALRDAGDQWKAGCPLLPMTDPTSS